MMLSVCSPIVGGRKRNRDGVSDILTADMLIGTGPNAPG